MKKILIFLLVLLLLIILIPVTVGGYYGFVPGVSTLFGSDKPKNLGITYTEAQMDTYNQKAKFTLSKSVSGNETKEGITFTGVSDISDTFTKEEVSARINYSPWKYMPISNVQVNFPSEDTVEFSANLDVEKIPGFINAVGFQVSNEDIDKGLKYIQISSNPAIYARARAEVRDNVPIINLENVQVGRFDVPIENYNADSLLESATITIFSKVPGFYAKSAKFSPNGLYFEGSVPTNAIVD